MTIEAKIICDSVNQYGSRLTTFLLKYPRFIHAEFMTHRMFSRNASSSRAIPVKKIIQQVLDDPAMPVFWGKNQAGMQAKEELTGHDLEMAKRNWLWARDRAVERAETLVELGLHKQIANRILEPWHHIIVVCTATEYANFFALRCHPDAQPEMKVLAELMAEQYRSNEPRALAFGEWHLPFVTPEEIQYHPILNCVKFSVARCARTSYMNHDGSQPDTAKDIDLHDKLIVQRPAHASPSEHQAQAADEHTPFPPPESNLKGGWHQYRKMVRHENITVLPWIGDIEDEECS